MASGDLARHRAVLTVGSAITEGTANFLVNRRINESQQMRDRDALPICCSRFVAPSTMARSVPTSDRNSSQPPIHPANDDSRRLTANLVAVPCERSHRAAGFGFAEGSTGFGQLTQQRGGGPALAVLLMPRLDLAVDFGDADAVGPVHQAAAVSREAEAVEPHHIDVAGAVGLALFEDLARLVDRGEEQPMEDLLVGEALLRDPELLRFFLDHAREFGVGMRGTVARLVAEPAGAGLLAEPPGLDDRVGDRHLAIVRVLRGAPRPAVVADVETREIGGRKRSDRIAEIDHHLVDLLGPCPLLDHDVHLGAKGGAAAVGDKAVAIAGHGTDLADLAAEIHRRR